MVVTTLVVPATTVVRVVVPMPCEHNARFADTVGARAPTGPGCIAQQRPSSMPIDQDVVVLDQQ